MATRDWSNDRVATLSEAVRAIMGPLGARALSSAAGGGAGCGGAISAGMGAMFPLVPERFSITTPSTNTAAFAIATFHIHGRIRSRSLHVRRTGRLATASAIA